VVPVTASHRADVLTRRRSFTLGGSGLHLETKGDRHLARWDNTKAGLRRHAFRTWTACAILAAYVYGWVYVPELLTWWKRTTTSVIEAGCSMLPYPWNDRIEATLGNFGLWVQVTLAIIMQPCDREAFT